MDSNDKNETFSYTYSAKQQEEVKRIREQYAPREENKLDALRRLDQSAKKAGVVASLIVGITGSLLLGTGMACILEWELFAIGLAVGLVGLTGVSVAYPIYTGLTKRRREKLAPQIIQLSDELMK